MAQYYFLDSNNQQKGPFSISELAGQKITKSTFVWKEGLKEWVEAGEVVELNNILTKSKSYNMNNKNDAHKVTFNSFALGVGIFIFFSTFSYWFASTDSQLSLVNILFTKYLNSDFRPVSAPATIQQWQWTKFYANLILTGIGLLIYYNSGFTHWLGTLVSHQYNVASFFYSNNKTAIRITYIFKAVISLLLVVTLYNLITKLIKADFLPLEEFRNIILIFFIGTAGWNIAFPELLEMPDFVGSLDNRNKTMWVRLADNQIAYIQNRVRKEEWLLSLPKSDTDFIFTEVYIFQVHNFSHHIQNIKLLKSTVGSIEGEFEMEPLLENFPKVLSFQKLQNFNSLTYGEQIKSMIYIAIDQNSMKSDVGNKYESLNTYFTTNPAASSDEWNDKFMKINRDINSASLDSMIANDIQARINNLAGEKYIFKVSCNVTHDSAREYFENKIRAHVEVTATAEQESLREERKIILGSIAKRLEHPGLTIKDTKTLMDLRKELRESTLNKLIIDKANGKLNNINRNKVVAEFNSEIIKAAKEIANTLLICKTQNYDRNTTKEFISESTSFFSNKNIPLEKFFEKLFEKWQNEKEERTEDAYELLVRDTLQSFVQNSN